MQKRQASMASSKFHMAMYPFFAMGHMIPFFHLSNELAARGHRISFLCPKKAESKLKHLNLYPNLITFYSITVPHVDGLPEDAEIASDIPTSLIDLLVLAMDRTRDQIQDFLHINHVDDHNKINMVFYNIVCWVPEITRQLGIKSICYLTGAAVGYAFCFVPARNFNHKLGGITEEKVSNLPPGYPSSTVVLHPGHELQSILGLWKPYELNGLTMYQRLTNLIQQCDALCMRACREMEGKYIDYLQGEYKKPVLLTGPAMSLDHTKNGGPLEKRWATWLGGFEDGSVVFCSFGSMWDLEKDQFHELLLGIELTGLPFFVALRQPAGCAKIEEALPDGFEERVKGRGLVYGGWVQQTSILRHPAVGCFLSHCGTGSMYEGLMSENQIVLLPCVLDHFLMTRILVEDLKVGVEVQKEENGWFSRESLSKAIKSVMDKKSEVGVMVKKNHAKWAKILSTPGFMSGYIDSFVQKLEEV